MAVIPSLFSWSVPVRNQDTAPWFLSQGISGPIGVSGRHLIYLGVFPGAHGWVAVGTRSYLPSGHSGSGLTLRTAPRVLAVSSFSWYIVHSGQAEEPTYLA